MVKNSANKSSGGKKGGGSGAKFKTASQRASQNKQGGKSGGGGGGGDAEKHLKEMLRLAQMKDAEKRKLNNSNDEDGDDDSGSAISYFERIPGLLCAFFKLIFRVPWADIITGQIINITSALEDAIDIIKNACAKWTSEGWSPFQNLFKAMGMRVVDYLANFFERHVPNLGRDRDQQQDYDPNHSNDDDLYHRKNNGNFSDDDNDDFWRGMKKHGDYGHHDPYDEYNQYNPYHSNTRSDGERHHDYGPQQESQDSRRKRAFPAIAGMGRSSIFKNH